MTKIKRRGSLGVAVIFALLFCSTVASFIVSQVNARSDIKSNREYYTHYYNLSALNKIATDSVLSDLCSKSITIPITPLNNNVFAYEEVFEFLKIPTRVSASELVSNLGDEELRSTFSFVRDNDVITFNTNMLNANYSHPKNILNFGSGDVLFLDTLEITAIIDYQNKQIKTKHTITGLSLNAIHKNNSIVLQLNDTDMGVIY